MLMVASVAVSAQEANISLDPAPFKMPRRIGPLVGDPAPHRYDDPRLGVSYQFNGRGASLTVYVYTAGVQDLKDGPDTIPTCQEFEAAKQGVQQAYQDVKLVSEHMVPLLPPKESPLMREAVFEFVREGRQKVSYVWITAASGHFLKLRFSVDQQFRDELPDARRAVLAAVAEAVEPHLAPVDPKAEKAGATLAINSNMMTGSKDDMGSGFMYLLLMNALTDKAPELGPVCGGEFVPGYEGELGVHRTAFLGDLDVGGKYGKTLRMIDKAGFLEEFVWVELHRDSWGDQAPEGLTLPEYQAWKKKKLKRFKVPNFGTVTIDHPRPLPLEAAP
jgi:hypothetical protein